MKKIFRQGDVLLVEIKEIPAGATIVPVNGDTLLALGEVTGHAHRIKEKKVVYFDAGAERYLQVLEKTALTHEEHSTIELDVGKKYQQGFQVEDFGTEIKRVVD